MGYNPQESLHYKYHGYTVRGTPNCPLIFIFLRIFIFVANLRKYNSLSNTNLEIFKKMVVWVDVSPFQMGYF